MSHQLAGVSVVGSEQHDEAGDAKRFSEQPRHGLRERPRSKDGAKLAQRDIGCVNDGQRTADAGHTPCRQPARAGVQPARSKSPPAFARQPAVKSPRAQRADVGGGEPIDAVSPITLANMPGRTTEEEEEAAGGEADGGRHH